jgi:ABC-2 type transport system permease protein
MNRLLKIEWIKIRSNATFWVLTGLHVGIVWMVILSGKAFFRNISFNGDTLKNLVDKANLPFYEFPDIWQNLTYVAGFLKFILAIYMIISITNEITFDTLRQNIMNGLSRVEFIVSKLILVLLLSAGSTLFLFVSGLTVGLVSTSQPGIHDMIMDMGFIPAYFLQLTAYLIFALMISLLIKRTGLAMGLMFLYTLIIEPIIAFWINDDRIKGLLPLKSISNLIHMPFGKYLLREIQDYVSLKEIVIVLVYIALFLYFIYILLKKRDLK